MTHPTGWLCGCGNGSLLGSPPSACPLCGFVFELPDYIDID
jgi:rubrerythrin